MSLLSRLRSATSALLGNESDTRDFSAKLQRLTPHDFIQWWSQAGMPHQFKPDDSIEAYGDNTWLYSAVNSIASEVSRIPLRLREVKADGSFEEVKLHQALTVLNNPLMDSHGKNLLTRKQMFFLLTQHLCLNGEAFWRLGSRMSERVGGSPQTCEPLKPGDVYLVPDEKTKGLLCYEYRPMGETLRFEPRDVVHFKLMNPDNFFRGHSPTKPIRFALDTHKEADKVNLNRILNNAIPAGYLKTDSAVHPDEQTKILNRFLSLFKGSKNAGRVGFMPKGVSYENVQQSNQEMQFSEGKDKNRDEILSAYRVGLEMLGKTESQTRANAESAIFVFMRFSVTPFYDQILDTLNTDFLPQFAGTKKLEFFYDDPVPENMDEKRENYRFLMEFGAATPNEARQAFGMEPLDVPEADMPHVGLNRLPLGTPAPKEEEPAEQEDDE